jgi:hypothetical protein
VSDELTKACESVNKMHPGGGFGFPFASRCLLWGVVSNVSLVSYFSAGAQLMAFCFLCQSLRVSSPGFVSKPKVLVHSVSNVVAKCTRDADTRRERNRFSQQTCEACVAHVTANGHSIF